MELAAAYLVLSVGALFTPAMRIPCVIMALGVSALRPYPQAMANLLWWLVPLVITSMFLLRGSE